MKKKKVEMLKNKNEELTPEMVGPYTELVFECSVCKKIYKDPGMCQTCSVLLKPRGG